MQGKEKIFLILLFVALVVFSIKYAEKVQQTNFNWFKVPETTELYLLDYEKESFKNIKFEIYSSIPTLCKITVCGYERAVNLSEGSNILYQDISFCELNRVSFLNISCGNQQNFFYIKRVLDSALGHDINFTNISLIKTNGYYSLQLEGSVIVKNSGYKKLDITLDGLPLLSPVFYFESGQNEFSFSEKIKIFSGSHKLKIDAFNKSVEKDFFVEEKAFPIDNLLLTLSALAISLLLKKKYNFDILLTILIFFSFFTAYQVFQFQLSKNFNLSPWLFPVVSVAFLGIVYGKKIKKQISAKFPADLKKEILIFAVLYIALVLLLKIFIGPHDIWWPYYSRNVENTYLNGKTFFVDDLSYLGRDFTFPPVFFEFASQVTELFGAKSFFNIQYYLHMILVAFFAVTSYLLFANFKTRRQRIVAVLIYSSLAFTFLTSVAGTLHTFSFVILNISVIFFNLKHPIRNLTPLLLALAFATHPITLLLFAVYVYVTNSFRINLRQIFLIGTIAVAISLLFYLPVFIKSGLPYEIVPRKWGYLLTFGVPVFDYQFLMPFIFISMLYGLMARGYRLPSVILLLFLLVSIYISFRANVVVSILLAGIFSMMFSDYLRNRLIFLLVLVPLLLNFAFATVIYSGVTEWCVWGAINKMCISPMLYLSNHTSTQENVAINPEFGHLEAYIGQRKVLADLYVEYADEKKFLAENKFYQNSNISFLKNYNISIFVLDDIGIKRNIIEAERIYDNGFFHIFRSIKS